MTASADWSGFDGEFARDLFSRAHHQAAQALRYAASAEPTRTVLSARPNAKVWTAPLRWRREQAKSG
jgi:hypothetical protein